MSVQEPLQNKSVLVLKLPQKAADFIMERWELGCSIVLDLNEYDFEINELTRNKISLEAVELNLLKDDITLSRLNSLKNQLLQGYKNLDKLLEKKSMYTALNVPLDLLNEIEKLEEEIGRLRKELGLDDN